MGCSQSKIENEEAVSRCKERKHYIKFALSARNAFTAANSAYAMSLKNAGAALSDFAQGETAVTINPLSLSSSSSGGGGVGGGGGPIPIPVQPIQTLPPPPPPIPDMPPTPLQRAASMPELAVPKRKPVSQSTIEEGDEDAEDEEEEEEGMLRRRRRRHSKSASISDPPPLPSTPPEVVDNRAAPPPPELNSSTYDYFFNVDDVPNGSLGDVEEARKENERRAFDEMPKRATPAESDAKASGEGGSGRLMEEKTLAEKPPLPPPPQQGKGVKKGKQVVRNNSGGEVKRRNLNLVQIVNELDDYFLKALESAHEVSKLLEATRLHYHSNFADNTGHIDHSARVMRVITWNRSFRGLNAEEYRDDIDSEENETLATVLDKLLAWEKKLYDEVKSGEIMKFEYQRKVASLNKQKKHGANPETLEKIKAAVSHLHTRYIVDMQAMDATVSEINRLRDDQLHPRLLALADAMATMWDAMGVCHENQYKITLALKALDVSQSVKETTDHHHERTIQLLGVVQEWHAQFEYMVNYQREYIGALNCWLKLNLIPVESNLKEKVSSPPRAQNPRIRALLLSWHDHLEKLPDEHTKSVIHNFAAVLDTIVEQQDDELKLRAKVEESMKDLEKKERQYDKWLKEYTKKRMARDDMGDDGGVPNDEAVVEREFVVENARKKLEEDRENYRKQCNHVREKTLTSLKTRLPELFQALAEFAHAASDMYINLRAVS